MACIKFINKNLFTVKVSEYIKDGASYSNIDLKTVATSEGKTKNVCRVVVPGANAEGPGQISDINAFVETYATPGHGYKAENSLIEKYHNVTTSLKLDDTRTNGSMYFIAAIPYNGNINSLTIASHIKDSTVYNAPEDYTIGPVEIINATTLKTESFAMNEKSKLKFAKILYVIFWGANPEYDTYSIDMSTTSYPKTDDGTIRIDRNLRLTVDTSADSFDNMIPTVTDTQKSGAISDEEINVTKFNQLFKNVKDDDVKFISDIAHGDAGDPYEIAYTNIIKEKRNNGGNNRRNGKSGGAFTLEVANNTKNPRSYRNSATDDATKKAHAHAKSVNKLNKAKDKFAE